MAASVADNKLFTAYSAAWSPSAVLERTNGMYSTAAEKMMQHHHVAAAAVAANKQAAAGAAAAGAAAAGLAGHFGASTPYPLASGRYSPTYRSADPMRRCMTNPPVSIL
jgi:hypothetical protein